MVVDGDGIRCGVERETRAAATGDTAMVEPGTSVDETGGARRGAKRGREGAEGHDTGETGDASEETREEPTSAERGRGGRRRRRATASYAEV